MECYTHQQNNAVGICKSCHKAVCRNCAIELQNGLACSEECEAYVDELNQMVERSFKIYGIGKYKSKIPSTGVIMWLLFSLFAWLAFLIPYFYKDKLSYSSLSMAVIFTIITALVVYSSKRTGIKC